MYGNFVNNKILKIHVYNHRCDMFKLVPQCIIFPIKHRLNDSLILQINFCIMWCDFVYISPEGIFVSMQYHYTIFNNKILKMHICRYSVIHAP